ncbi:hypothetical protein AB0K09_11870 [Streptomyces sp. NPDC049577]|uniref:hypothetical protein n=1 Tax=Streptomyces sp. NPDC049577 TaxID=3155153 RepID=UPI00341C0A71
MVDVRRDRVGEVMSTADGRLWLRAPVGGREWEALPCDVQPATANDQLRVKVADANHRSGRRWTR